MKKKEKIISERMISIPILEPENTEKEDGTLDLKKVSLNIMDNYLLGNFKVLKETKKTKKK